MIERACPDCRTGPVDVPEFDRWMECMFCGAIWRIEIRTVVVPGDLWKKAWGDGQA